MRGSNRRREAAKGRQELGVWGNGLFDEDVAADVRATFEDAWAIGKPVPDITRRVLMEYENAFDDEGDGPQIVLALAALQLQHGALQPEIRDRALTIIRNDEGMERWVDAGGETLAERRRVLASLQAQLVVFST